MRRCMLALAAPLLAAACAAPGLPAGFAAAAAQAPEDQPARLCIDGGGAIVAAAAGLGRGGLPSSVRIAADAIAPGGDLVFLGREWGPRGDGYRIEKHYVEGAEESFRSLLLRADGTVLERAHSVPVVKVPADVLHAAMAIGHQVVRCEIVSGAEREEGWRVLVRDGTGRSHVVEAGLDGRLQSARRLVQAVIQVP